VKIAARTDVKSRRRSSSDAFTLQAFIWITFPSS
jgi:hypothetical protein